MTMIDAQAIWFGVLCGAAFYMIGYVVMYDFLSVRRVGGITFWRFGSLGGSIYRKAR